MDKEIDRRKLSTIHDFHEDDSHGHDEVNDQKDEDESIVSHFKRLAEEGVGPSNGPFRHFKAPELPPVLPEKVIENLMQLTANSSAEISRRPSEEFGQNKDEPETKFENGLWSVQGYIDSKEVRLDVQDPEHSVSIRDCAGWRAPTVVVIHGVCRNLTIHGCTSTVVIAEGVKAACHIQGTTEVSLYFSGYFPSPLTLREIDGLQITAVGTNIHSSVSVTHGADIFFNAVPENQTAPKPKQRGWGGWGAGDDTEQFVPEDEGGVVQVGHIVVDRRRHVHLPLRTLITAVPAFTTRLPREGVFVFQEGRITKSADVNASVVTHAPLLLYNGHLFH